MRQGDCSAELVATMAPYASVTRPTWLRVHGADPSVIRRTVRLARELGVAVGAHPGFPDLIGFGRRELRASPAEVEDMVLYQLGAIAGIAAAEQVKIRHVKAHGALYNMAARDAGLAAALARAVAAFDPTLIFFGLPGSELLNAGRAAGLRVAAEAFADRAYAPDGSLASRSVRGSVIDDADQVLGRVLRMVREHTVVAVDGTVIALEPDTLCVHGDTPGAAHLAAVIRGGLEAAGVRVAPVGAA